MVCCAGLAAFGSVQAAPIFQTTVPYSSNQIQEFVVPMTGLYSITAFGAQGGGANGGRGAIVGGKFYLYQNKVLDVMVGGQGGFGSAYLGGGGGGGTFVVTALGAPMVVAGGGGGQGRYQSVNIRASDGFDHHANAGGAGQVYGVGAGGAASIPPVYVGGCGGCLSGGGGGAGGGPVVGTGFGGGGGGFDGSGGGSGGGGGGDYPGGSGGGGGSGYYDIYAFGVRIAHINLGNGGNGGYGGGGGGAYGGGGGGGYLGGGGGAGDFLNAGGGGGGGSYINATLLTGVGGGNPGNGRVLISYVPEPATWTLMLTGIGLMGAALRRRRRMLAA